MFETALRKKYRFKTDNGVVTTEDIVAMSPANLDKVAILLHKEIAEKATPSNGSLFVTQKVDTTTNDKLALVKYVFNSKLAAQELAVQQKEKDERRQQLLEARHAKQLDQINSKSIEEIDAELAKLD